MSGHDTHAPVQQTKGIWALPLTAWIIVVILVFIFTMPNGEAKHEAEHEKTEAPAHH